MESGLWIFEVGKVVLAGGSLQDRTAPRSMGVSSRSRGHFHV
jgi:hypothetical protein